VGKGVAAGQAVVKLGHAGHGATGLTPPDGDGVENGVGSGVGAGVGVAPGAMMQGWPTLASTLKSHVEHPP